MNDTMTLRRIYDVPPERMWRAWTERAELQRWNCPADGWTLEVLEVDLRVGGRYRAAFGPPGEEPFVETDDYLEITPPRRLVFTETITRGGVVQQRTVCTVEFIDRGGRTELVITERGADAEVHRSGWTWAIEQLAIVVRSAA
jgi:uncharacterized protein YndB with AHSA1/START domain